jgi:enterochelin esterase-like enzyme
MAFAAAVVSALSLLPAFHQVATGPHGGIVLEGTFPGSQRPGLTYLPPRFDASRRYPVVYLLHGLPGSPTEYLYGAELARFADDGIAAGTLRPFIAVIPAGGPTSEYDGEWAGPLEREVVNLVPWVDRHLPTIASARGRIIAGLSAGGFGAADIGVRNPRLFGTILSWSGYFTPLHDGPFKSATPATLNANNPTLLVRSERAVLRRDRTRFFISTGPYHSHWFTPAESFAFERELRSLKLPVASFSYPSLKGQWRAQLDRGLDWALAPGPARTS